LLGEEADLGFCVEVGAGIGTQNNTRALVDKGWSALWIDPKLDRVAPLDNVHYNTTHVTSETILDAINKAPKRFDILSVDIDGVDYYVVATLLNAGYRPKIAVIEYNASWGPDDAVAVVYNPGFRWAGDNYFSASLQAWVDLFAVYGYGLIGCESVGADAFFQLGAPVIKAAEAFRPPAYGNGRGHKPSRFQPVPVSPPKKPRKRRSKKKKP